MTTNRILLGDAIAQLRTLPSGLAHACVTSPPYWGLRDYGVEGQIGLERSPEEYVARIVEIFREVRRVLRVDGTLWLNLGDSYAGSGKGQGPEGSRHRKVKKTLGMKLGVPDVPQGLKPKDLVGIPWRVAFALRADGWYLRSDIIWHKRNPMPESVTDRPTRSHEYVFLLAKSPRYYYDAKAVKEASVSEGSVHVHKAGNKTSSLAGDPRHATKPQRTMVTGPTRNLRDVWPLATQPYTEAHFATFPEKLIEPCIKAGCPKDGVVLDPFMGSGTTAFVARRLGRRYLGVEINPAYVKLAERRLASREDARDGSREPRPLTLPAHGTRSGTGSF